jgi:transposase
MTMLAESVDAVIGVDTHTDTHTACLVTPTGQQMAAVTVEASPDGYAKLLGWAVDHAPGPRLMWAVEGARSHGAGLSRLLLAAGQLVVEAGRPERVGRRPGGKSDPIDAYQAARQALTATHHAAPRGDGDREALRILLVAREHANTTRTAAVNIFKALVLTAPDHLRESLRHKTTPRQTAACVMLRTHARHSTAERILRQTLRALAQQIRLLDKEIRANERQLHQLVTSLMPALLAEPGVGPVSAAHLIVAWSHPGRCRSEAAFAALAGVSPLPASSGRVTRHRLNRFGDRRLNRALHTIVTWRMTHGHPPTLHYLTRRRAHQKSDAEIRRCLKRYAARHLFRIMEAAHGGLDRP